MTSTTPNLDLGSRRIPGWYWMLSGEQREPYIPRADAAAGELRHCFSYERSQPSVKEAALSLINGAKEKIFLASFRFIDDDLREALRAAAARLRGGVYVVISINEDKDLRDTLDFPVSYEEDEEEDWYDEADPTATPRDINEQENKKHYPDLCASGVWVRGHPHFHAKFLVVDDSKALVSSANLESAALADAIDRPGRAPGFDAVTGESGIVTTRRADAELLGKFFARLWYAECTWDAPASEHYRMGPRNTVPAWFTVGRTPLGAPGPIWTGSDDRLILAAIHDICALATTDLVLATFSTAGLEDHPDLLFDPVYAAVKREVRVRLLLRSRNYEAARNTAGTLAGWGVQVYGDDKTHAKCAIADGKHGAIFSANFDAEHGIYDGTEMGMRLDGEPVLADVAHFFDHCIACAPQHLVQNPTAAQGTSLAARMLRDWPLPAGLAVRCEDGAWSALAATTGPVLFTAPAARVAGAVTLHADGGQWTLTGPAAEARWRLTMIARPATADRDRPPALLTEWLGAGRRAAHNDPYRDHRRGLCPASLRRG